MRPTGNPDLQPLHQDPAHALGIPPTFRLCTIRVAEFLAHAPAYRAAGMACMDMGSTAASCRVLTLERHLRSACEVRKRPCALCMSFRPQGGGMKYGNPVAWAAASPVFFTSLSATTTPTVAMRLRFPALKQMWMR